MRIARDLGDMSLLMPDGISHLQWLPYNIFNAIRQALAFLGFEEMPSDERPPRHIWLDSKAMNEHWKKVERIQREKYGLEDKDEKWSDKPLDGPESKNATAELLFGGSDA